MTLTITPPSNVGCESIAVITLSIFLNVKLYGNEKTRRTRSLATAAINLYIQIYIYMYLYIYMIHVKFFHCVEVERTHLRLIFLQFSPNPGAVDLRTSWMNPEPMANIYFECNWFVNFIEVLYLLISFALKKWLSGYVTDNWRIIAIISSAIKLYSIAAAMHQQNRKTC